MVNKTFISRTFIIVLLFGILVIENLEAQIDSRLNGVWGTVVNGIKIEYRFTNGNFESYADEVPDSRGTYTTNNTVLTFQPTHVHGRSFNNSLGYPALELRWYTKNEFIIAVKNILTGRGLSENVINQFIALIVSPPSPSYSVDFNTLILSSISNGISTVVILNKK